jgi:hypothetical protein
MRQHRVSAIVDGGWPTAAQREVDHLAAALPAVGQPRSLL